MKKNRENSIFYFLFSIFSRRRNGYIAVVSSLIIAGVIVLIVLAVGQTSFLNRAGIAGSHYKERSRALAGACVNTALLKLSDDPDYAGSETITVASDTCVIYDVQSSSTGRIVETQGEFQRSYTNLRVTVASDTVDIIEWGEVKSF